MVCSTSRLRTNLMARGSSPIPSTRCRIHNIFSDGCLFLASDHHPWQMAMFEPL